MKKASQSDVQLMFFQDIYVGYLNLKLHDDGIIIVASRACQRGPILPRERILGLKIIFLDPKVASKQKMSLIKVVGHIMIDLRTKFEVVGSMYVVRNPKKRPKIQSRGGNLTKNHVFGRITISFFMPFDVFCLFVLFDSFIISKEFWMSYYTNQMSQDSPKIPKY